MSARSSIGTGGPVARRGDARRLPLAAGTGARRLPLAAGTGALAALAAGTGALAGCAPDDRGIAAPDGGALAGHDATSEPDATTRDGDIPLAWIDFAIDGCEAAADGGEAPGAACAGDAPLTLRFVPLAPAPIDVYRWSFGDETPEGTAPTPVHTFELPGTYDISLIAAGPGGTARADREGGVVVRPAALGDPCHRDGQCASELCRCAGGACSEPAVAGFCAAACGPESPCGDGAACADLNAAGASAPEPWQAATCVPTCAGDDDCPDGSACFALPAAFEGDAETGAGGDALTRELLSDADESAEGGWVRGCFSRGALTPLGGDCVDGAGEPIDDACASGHCADLGARGMCAAECEGESACPGSAACAEFGDSDDLPPLCLHRCADQGDPSDPAPCHNDPWLACEDPGGGGELSFTVDPGDPDDSRYCAPKSCQDDADCGSDGSCHDGHCGP